MEIRLSSPDPFFSAKIEEAATRAGCFARIKWATATSARFTLVNGPVTRKQALFEQQDAAIARLFMHDPHAVIRTARATYEGAADFQAQKAARVPA